LIFFSLSLLSLSLLFVFLGVHRHMDRRRRKEARELRQNDWSVFAFRDQPAPKFALCRHV
jgi:hypothetical protein